MSTERQTQLEKNKQKFIRKSGQPVWESLIKIYEDLFNEKLKELYENAADFSTLEFSFSGEHYQLSGITVDPAIKKTVMDRIEKAEELNAAELKKIEPEYQKRFNVLKNIGKNGEFVDIINHVLDVGPLSAKVSKLSKGNEFTKHNKKIKNLVKFIQNNILIQMYDFGIKPEDLSLKVSGIDVKFSPKTENSSKNETKIAVQAMTTTQGLYRASNTTVASDYTDEIFGYPYDGDRRAYSCPITEYNPFRKS